MPEMTGVEFLAEVYERHPNTVRMILTGFADMDATIGAINDGHVYAYVTKPWEPDELKQVVRRAVELPPAAPARTSACSTSCAAPTCSSQAVMDQLDTGALAVDAAGVVRAANRPAARVPRASPRTRAASPLERMLAAPGLAERRARRRRGSAPRERRDAASRSSSWRAPARRLRAARRSARAWSTTPARPIGRVVLAARDLPRAAAPPLRGAGRGRAARDRARCASCSSAAQAELRKLAAEASGSGGRLARHGRARRARLAHRAPPSSTGSPSTTRSPARTIPTRSCCASACASRRRAGRSPSALPSARAGAGAARGGLLRVRREP